MDRELASSTRRVQSIRRHLCSAELVDDGRVETSRVDDGRVLVITLARPHKLNGFTPKMFQQLGEAFTELENDPKIRVGVLCAQGKHFSAGIDMGLVEFKAKFFPEGLIDPVGLYPPTRTKPLVTAVQGVTFTIGLELALASDIVVAATGTRFSQMEVKRGILPFCGGSFRIAQRAGWGNAMRYVLTGDEFDQDKASAMGIVQEVCPFGSQLDIALEIATKIAAQAPVAVSETLASAREAVTVGEAAAINSLAGRVEKLKATQDFQEGVASFKEKRPPKWIGK